MVLFTHFFPLYHCKSFSFPTFSSGCIHFKLTFNINTLLMSISNIPFASSVPVSVLLPLYCVWTQQNAIFPGPVCIAPFIFIPTLPIKLEPEDMCQDCWSLHLDIFTVLTIHTVDIRKAKFSGKKIWLGKVIIVPVVGQPEFIHVFMKHKVPKKFQNKLHRSAS